MQKENRLIKFQEHDIPGMPSRPRTPRADSIICPDKILARERGIVPIRPPLDQLPIDLGSPVPAPVVRAERVAEGSRGRRQEGGWEGARRPLGEERDAGLELVGQPRQGGDGAVFVLSGWCGGVVFSVVVLAVGPVVADGGDVVVATVARRCEAGGGCREKVPPSCRRQVSSAAAITSGGGGSNGVMPAGEGP